MALITLGTCLGTALPLAVLPALGQPQPLMPFSEQSGGPRPGSLLSPTQRQQLFPAWRSLALQGLRARQAILQNQRLCLDTAARAEDLKGCMRQERRAMALQHQQHRQALRQLFERYGIPLPPRLLGPGRWGEAPRGGDAPGADL